MKSDVQIYRVRKSFKAIKTQKGAFFTFSAAVKTADKYKLNVYDNSGTLLYSAARRRQDPFAWGRRMRPCEPPDPKGEAAKAPHAGAEAVKGLPQGGTAGANKGGCRAEGNGAGD